MTRIARAVLFIALMSIIVAGLQRTMHSYGGGQTWWDLYLDEPKDSIDVLFLGSSHAHSTTSPLDLWDEYGFTSFNLTGSSQGLETSYYFLREALKTQHPKAVVLELYMIQGYQMNDQAMASNYGLMPWGTNKIKGYAAEAGSPLDFQYLLLPLLRDHSRWSMLTRDDFAKLWRGPEKPPPTAGVPVDFQIADATVRYEEAPPSTRVYEHSLQSLEKIAELCEGNDVQLLLYFCPQSLPDQASRLSEIQERLSAYGGVDYLDMNDAAQAMSLDLTTDFAIPDGHLNRRGAIKANHFLGEYLRTRYGLVDRREDQAYERWGREVAAFRAYEARTLEEFEEAQARPES